MESFFASAKMPRTRKRRICFPLTSRAYYGRTRLLIQKLHAHAAVDLQLMLGGSILLDKYSRHIADDIEKWLGPRLARWLTNGGEGARAPGPQPAE